MQRRAFLKCSVATVSSLAAVHCGHAREDDDLQPRDATERPDLFPQSVASGDPSATSVVLWTRYQNPSAGDSASLELEVFGDAAGTDPVPLGASRYTVAAVSAFDHCAKVRVEGLEPAVHYWYRFVVRLADGSFASSPMGRTKTAPAPEADTPVRFAVMSCQDYIGRYYNALAHAATQELDFVIHLGDYIYETLGDPSFQSTMPERSLEFLDLAGALTVGEGENAFRAAQSLDNYRQLYRTYRSDAALQRMHERFATILIWDDHEFSNDCHGSTATYSDGRRDETDMVRRANANQAWFEYMPVDYENRDYVYDRSRPPPGDIKAYRSFGFGQHLQLIVTDLRSHRSDHLIPEDAYPGLIVAGEATLMAFGGIPEFAERYVPDIDTFAGGVYASLLRATADQEGFPAERIAGPISAQWIQDVVAAQESPTVDPLDAETLGSLPRGLSISGLGKSRLYSSFGSRYVVRSPAFELWSRIRYEQTGGASEDIMGAEQEAWFLETARQAPATWVVWGNPFCLMPLDIDFSGSVEVPRSLAHPLTFNVDDWNGAPNRRSALIHALAQRGNVVALTGDLHTFLAGTPMTRDGTQSIVEFVLGSISSANFLDVVGRQVLRDPALAGIPGISILLALLPSLLTGPTSTNPHLAATDTENHGYGIVTVDAQQLHMTWVKHGRELVATPLYDAPQLDAMFVRQEFRVPSGNNELWMLDGETWVRWDAATQTWI